jgi:hypothetical protein
MAMAGDNRFNDARPTRVDAPPGAARKAPHRARVDAAALPALAPRRPDLPDYIRSIIALPNPEHDTWVAPGISRAKS